MNGTEMVARISALFTSGSRYRRRRATRFSLRYFRSCSRIHRGTRKGGAGTPTTLKTPNNICGSITKLGIPIVIISISSEAPRLCAKSVKPTTLNANRKAGIMWRNGPRRMLCRGQVAEGEGVSSHLTHRMSATSAIRPPIRSQIFMS